MKLNEYYLLSRAKLFCDPDSLDTPVMDLRAVFEDDDCFEQPQKATKDHAVSKRPRCRNEDIQLPPSKKLAMQHITCDTEAATAKRFLSHVDEGRDLIGDGSKNHCLPLIPGKHSDLKCVSVDTVSMM